MGTSETDSENDVDQPTRETLLDKLRSAGPGGYVFLGALLLAFGLVAVNLVGSDDTSAIEVTDTSITTEVPATIASDDSSDTDPVIDVPADRTALRSAMQAFEQCMRDRGFPVRIRSGSETELELGLRGAGDPEAILADPATEECLDLHLSSFDMTLSVTDASRDDSASATTIPESTDGSTPPTQPTTDTTAP